MATPTPTPAFAPVERPLEEDEPSDTGRLEFVSAETGGAVIVGEEDCVVEVESLIVVVVEVEEEDDEEEPDRLVVFVPEVVEASVVMVEVGGLVFIGRSLGCHRIETPSAWK